MFCTSCGTNNEDGATFCTGCGKSLSDASAATAAPVSPDVNATTAAYQQPMAGAYQQPAAGAYQQPAAGAYQQQAGYYQQPAYPQKKSKTGLIIAIVLGGLAILVGLTILIISLVGGGSSSNKGFDTPQEASEQMIQWVFDENWDAIYDNMPVLSADMLAQIADGGSSVTNMAQYKVDGSNYFARYYGTGSQLETYTLRGTENQTGSSLTNIVSNFFANADYQVTGFTTITYDFTYTQNGSSYSDYMNVMCIQVDGGQWYPIWYN